MANWAQTMTSLTCPRSRRRARQGVRRAFTLLELLLTLAVMAALVGVAVPTSRRSFRRFASEDAALTLAANVRFAQARAITESAPVSLVLDLAGGRYHLATGLPGGGPVRLRLPGVAGADFTLPEGVSFGRVRLFAEDGVSRLRSLTFHPDGSGPLGTIRIAGPERAFEVELTRRLGEILLTEVSGDVPFE